MSVLTFVQLDFLNVLFTPPLLNRHDLPISRRVRPLPNGLRRQVRQKTNKQCCYCGDRIENDFHCDHVVPYSRGGPSTYENLVPSCPECNRAKSDKTPKQWSRFIERHTEINRRYRAGETPPLTFAKVCREQGIGLRLAASLVDQSPRAIESMYLGFNAAPAWMLLRVLESLDVPWKWNDRYRDARDRAELDAERTAA